jgi:response regulator of citrate/malate metabolism
VIPRVRTLIVDDDPAVVRLHSTYLAAIPGFDLVGAARTGAAAARFAAENTVDLVLLDMNLPDFSGIEVLHRLRMVREWDVDVLVISSARDGFTVRQALAAHVVGYLVKPFTKDAFVARLTEYHAARARRITEAAAETTVGLGQGEIDRLVAPSTGAISTSTGTWGGGIDPLPKGLSASTMRTVLDRLDTVAPTSARAISDDTGASRATVRRYLDHLVATGAVTVSHRFGARGRPEVLYRRAGGGA